MEQEKMKTILLKNKPYVQVNERLLKFNEDYLTGSISTEVTFSGDTVYFKATITPKIEEPTRIFVGHSFGTLGKEKAFEKLETVAVGRALAFMGIGIVEGIASADEMDKFYSSEPKKTYTPGKGYTTPTAPSKWQKSVAKELDNIPVDIIDPLTGEIIRK